VHEREALPAAIAVHGDIDVDDRAELAELVLHPDLRPRRIEALHADARAPRGRQIGHLESF
jgi:hypothetical protein